MRFANGDARIPIAIALRRSSAPGLGSRGDGSRPDSSLASSDGHPCAIRMDVLARVLGVAPDEVPDEVMRASLASYARYWREAFR